MKREPGFKYTIGMFTKQGKESELGIQHEDTLPDPLRQGKRHVNLWALPSVGYGIGRGTLGTRSG